MDSGCTGEAFVDAAFVKAHEIPTTPLPHPKPLYLADGELTDWIRETATLPLRIGAHNETVTFFVTPLAAENPIILGIPWLQRHNPAVDWNTLDVRFSNCGLPCLPLGAPSLAPRAVEGAPRRIEPPVTTNYRPATVEDLEEDYPGDAAEADDGAADDNLSEEVDLRRAAYKKAKRARQQRARRRSDSPPPPPTPPPKLTPYIARRAGPMRVTTKPRPPTPRFIIETPTAAASSPINPADIRFLSAPNFFLLARQARQQGVRIMRTTMGELENAVRKTEADEAPSILLPEISEGTFKDMLRGKHNPTHWKEIFPEECHEIRGLRI